MSDLGKIDRNLAAVCPGLEDMDVYSPDHENFELSGFYWRKKGGAFTRLPEDMDLSFHPYLKKLTVLTAGGKLRFRSNATEIRIHAVVGEGRMCHMAFVGSRGFDLYVGQGHTQVFAKSTAFPEDKDEYTAKLFSSPNALMRDFTIYFPLYAAVKELHIALNHGAELLPPTPYGDPRPIVLYGTSITQGGCVSRPGMLYSNILSRLIRRPICNYGFSGNGTGDPEIAEKLAEIADPAMFILDYDDNALPDKLEKTLRPFIAILRKKHPQTPILCLSTEPKSAEAFEPFDSAYGSQERLRYTAIHQQVQAELRRAGDDNIYFIDGRMLYGADFEECTVDGAHATDLGTYRIAHALAPAVEHILNRWW